MSYLLDTNVLGELRKPPARRDAGVTAWWRDVRAEDLFLSVLTVGEIRKRIERVRPDDPAQADALDRWLVQVETFYADRILPVTEAIAVRWGRVQAQHNYPVIDALIAATADEHGLCFVSRNVADLSGWPSFQPPLNPFSG
ncbi:MAG: type II toxin-antitoxin system VapC family toxin [Solimonas sp.]